ncbi:finTRIM family, member 16 isoform X1 [Silurus meridionalis]|nr:finTRIM family, member 16 isoform X1 [Silurus meridionalis]
MAEASISVDQDLVTVPCGHSFCKVCINDCWDQEEQKGVYSCPQCRHTFTPRPVLHRNNMLAEVVEKLKNKTEVQAASPDHCYAGPGDVECDFCTGRKHKAVKSCLVCVTSFCEIHLKPHLDVPALKKHTLTEASAKLQEKICSEHDEVLKIYCRTDQISICSLCMLDKGHDAVSVTAGRAEKQSELKEEQMKSQQRIQEKQKKVQELKQAVNTIKSFQSLCVSAGRQSPLLERPDFHTSSITVHQHHLSDGMGKYFSDLKKKLEEFCEEEFNKIPAQDFCYLTLDPNTAHRYLILSEKNRALSAQTAVEDTERIFTELISSMEKKRSEVKEKIRAQEEAELRRTEKHMEKLQQEITDLQRRDTELEQLLHTHDHIHTLQSFTQPASKKKLEEFCEEEFNKIPAQDFCYLTLDPNTAHRNLILSEKNRAVRYSVKKQQNSDHPERFDSYIQVLCEESVCGRCYWEVERSGIGVVSISVSYKDISRKGRGDECRFGLNNQSWSLWCSSSSLCFYHNNIKTDLRVPSSSRIGVYVDHYTGTLSFYSVSDTMNLLHSVQTTFTQPLYAGFGFNAVVGFSPRLFNATSTVKLCDEQI